jgi:hypothetical protein
MKLNRNNYEEYFILYLDNELDAESRRDVEAFAKQNPDLKAELDMLMQSKLTPDADISFSNKGSLIRFDNASISLSNYEEWLTSYIDDELTEGERRDVEVFVAGNPAIQRELNLLQQTKLQPETVVFPYKDSLYRKEEKARLISVRWWKIAAAAVLLLGIGTTAIVLINNKKGGAPGDVVANSPKVEEPSNNPAIKQPVNESKISEQVVVTGQKKDESGNAIAHQNSEKKKKEKKEQVENVPAIAKNNHKEEKRSSNNLTQPDYNPYVKGQADPNSVVVKSTPPVETLTIPQENMGVSNVTPGVIHTSQIPTSESEEGVAKSSGNKGIRGFLRKVTRTIEKRTNIKATDDDDRLLIAGLAIKM